MRAVAGRVLGKPTRTWQAKFIAPTRRPPGCVSAPPPGHELNGRGSGKRGNSRAATPDRCCRCAAQQAAAGRNREAAPGPEVATVRAILQMNGQHAFIIAGRFAVDYRTPQYRGKLTHNLAISFSCILLWKH